MSGPLYDRYESRSQDDICLPFSAKCTKAYLKFAFHALKIKDAMNDIAGGSEMVIGNKVNFTLHEQSWY